VKYSDVEPYLSRQSVRISEKNDASLVNLDDYFTLNKYKGKIYKTNNSQGKTLAQIVGNDSTKLSAEQKRIEAELEQFEKNLWGDQAKKDSLDSIAKAQKDVKGTKKAKNRRAGGSTTKKEKSVKSRPTASSSSAARVSVRRQRH
jgi:hypothetical protein